MVDPTIIPADESSFEHCIDCDEVGHESMFEVLEGHKKTRCPSCGARETYNIDTYKCADCGTQFGNQSDAEDCCTERW